MQKYSKGKKMDTKKIEIEEPKVYSVITRIDDELFESLETARFKDRRTRSSAVRLAIKEYCEKIDAKS